MVRRKLASRLCAMIVVALLAAGAGQTNKAAHAEGVAVSGETALAKAVEIHEKLCGSNVEIPADIDGNSLSDSMLKSVMLGYVNMDDAQRVSVEAITKQDMMTVLYKTVISYDSSYAISADEAELILNNCYDNVYINDENRIAYAFMMKHGIITDKIGSEPDKKLTEESCNILTDMVYKLFVKRATLNNGDCDITIGGNIDTVIEKLGEPNRVDVSEYGFEWYVYNANYEKFVMIGVRAGRICAFYTNNSGFSVGEIKSGDDFAKIIKFEKDENMTVYTDTDGKVDAVLYNPYMKGSDNAEELANAKADELLDLINVNRSKNHRPIYIKDEELSEKSKALLSEFADGNDIDESASLYRSYSVFNMYNEYLNDGSRFLDNDNKYPESVGIDAYIDDKDRVVTCLVGGKGASELSQSHTVSLNRDIPEVKQVDEITTPVLEAPVVGSVYNDGDDVSVKLAMQAASKYHVEIFDVETDDYAVNEYITTDALEITFPAELFTNGHDYRLTLTSISPDGTMLPSDEVLLSYGSAFDSGIEILTPCDGEGTDDDYFAVSWKSDTYHDFKVEVYNASGELTASRTVEDKNEAVIDNVEPGEYDIFVTALRRGTAVEKAQASVHCSVYETTPVIEEIILDRDDKYYFVYEDEDLGVLYLYDEELVDVTEKNASGKKQTVTKKKIIKKQVKATNAYRKLAANRIKREYTTGEPVLTPTSVTASSELGRKIVNTAAGYLGVPYVWGGTTPDGFDCSGLVQYVLNSLGINISRVTQTQVKEGVPVSKGDLQPGDLVFFESNGDVHHVGIYVGNGMMIHAPRTGDVVRYQSIETPYYESQYAGARRVY